MLNKQLIKEYISTQGVRCINPDCHSHELSTNTLKTRGEDVVTQVVSCDDCWWTWEDEYTLTGIRNLDKGDSNA